MTATTPQMLTPDQLIQRSAQQYQAGQFDAALATCQQIIAIDLNHAVAWSGGFAGLAWALGGCAGVH
jgi:hypothetical protein